MKSLKYLLALVALFVFAGVKAQDKIFKKTGDVTTAKVVEVNEEYIVYKLFNNPEGPDYKIRKDAVTKVVYQNGTTETFSAEEPFKSMNAPKPARSNATMEDGGDGSNGLGYNLVNFDFLSILFTEVGFSYERILNNGYIGMKIPVLIGLGEVNSDQVRDYSNRFQTGLDLNLYPTGQGRAKYFIGPSLRVGKAYNSNYYYSDPYYNVIEENRDYNLLAFQVNNGVMFQPTKHFSVSLVLGIGLRKLTPEKGQYSTITGNYATFSANIGYRF